MKEAQNKLGFKLAISEDIEEGPKCYEEAKKLAQQGCDIIFADSFGHETHMIKAAKEFKNVLFCHATGTMAAAENLDNYGNAFASPCSSIISPSTLLGQLSSLSGIPS